MKKLDTSKNPRERGDAHKAVPVPRKSNGHEIVNSFKATLVGDLLKEIR